MAVQKFCHVFHVVNDKLIEDSLNTLRKLSKNCFNNFIIINPKILQSRHFCTTHTDKKIIFPSKTSPITLKVFF